MPPPKAACQIIATTYEVKAELISRIKDVRDAVLKAVKLRNVLKYGINIADALGGELVAAIGSVASQVATTLLGSVSGIASSVMEGVLNKLLQILLAFPTAIFSIVAIPHEAAKDAVAAERRYLSKCQNNVRTILRLVLKWTKGVSGQRYYEQIRDALPFIESAINLAGAVIRDLENTENSVFDESKYNQMRNNLAQAIQITTPFSVLDNTLQISNRIEQDKNRIYREKATAINTKYRQDKADAAERFQKKTIEARAGNSGNNSSLNMLSNATKEQYTNLAYQNEVQNLDNQRKVALSRAEGEAEIEAIKQSSNITNNLKNVIGDFANDMQILQEQLTQLLDNTRDAFLKYKESQVLCGNIYDSRNIIKNIVNQLISLIRAGSNEAGQALSIPIETAQGLMEGVRDDFQDDVDRYVASDSGISSTELSLSVVLGNGGLTAAESLLNTSVTDSLIAIINSDDVLQASDERFEQFLQDLSDIPDWDGDRGVWAVDVVNSATSPYVQLVADCTEALAKIPALAITSKESDKRRISQLIRDVDDGFRTLNRHNRVVDNVLGSYTPYMASEAGDIKAILASAGLLRNFALAMSITTLAADILSTTKGELGDEFPTYQRCKDAYPDLFDNLDLAVSSVTSKQDMPAEQESNEFQEKSEEKEIDLNAAREISDTTNFNTLVRSLNDLKDTRQFQTGDFISPSTG